jgi:YggT family protein
MISVFADSARIEVADYLSALFNVYSLILIAWIVAQLVFSLGVSPPYARWSSALFDFLRDVSEPYLRIFRRLGLRIGPIDLSPLVALLVLGIVGSIIVDIVRG